MSPRILLARSLQRVGEFLRTLPVVVLRPQDMLAWSRDAYDRHTGEYGRDNDVDDGLAPEEAVLWQPVRTDTGRILLLGGGGGREAIFFARQGSHVTAVDFSLPMLELARVSAAERGIAIDLRVGELSQLEAAAAAFDVAWISMFLYSVGSAQRRVFDVRQSVSGWSAVSARWPRQGRGARATSQRCAGFSTAKWTAIDNANRSAKSAQRRGSDHS
jgi:SAM-dependent methyltransferase